MGKNKEDGPVAFAIAFGNPLMSGTAKAKTLSFPRSTSFPNFQTKKEG